MRQNGNTVIELAATPTSSQLVARSVVGLNVDCGKTAGRKSLPLMKLQALHDSRESSGLKESL